MSDTPYSDQADARYVVRRDARQNWFIIDTHTGKTTERTPGGSMMREDYARRVCENLNVAEAMA